MICLHYHYKFSQKHKQKNLEALFIAQLKTSSNEQEFDRLVLFKNRNYLANSSFEKFNIIVCLNIDILKNLCNLFI